MNELYKTLKSLPQSVLKLIIFKLMTDGLIEYHDLTRMYVEYLEDLRKGQSEHYRSLLSKVIQMHCDKKSNQNKNLKEIMHYLRDCGEVNLTHEQIDAK